MTDASLPRNPPGKTRPAERMRIFAVLAGVTLALAGCKADADTKPIPLQIVRTVQAEPTARSVSVSLTGEIKAETTSDLSFRTTGQVKERLVEIGAHVVAGQLLARLDSADEEADVASAKASVTAQEAQLRAAEASYERQKSLLPNGYTARASFDQAQETLRTSQSALESARAQLGTAIESLSYTELRAPAAGIITSRSIEVGQVVQSAQVAYQLALDGKRDAVFSINEAMLVGPATNVVVHLALLSNPAVTALGHVREVAPAVDSKTGTVQVKIAIDGDVERLPLGAAVTGTVTHVSPPRVILPWSALSELDGGPAVWIVDPATSTVKRKAIKVETYDTGSLVVASGLERGDRVVVVGTKMLTPGQKVEATTEGEGK